MMKQYSVTVWECLRCINLGWGEQAARVEEVLAFIVSVQNIRWGDLAKLVLYILSSGLALSAALATP